CERGRLAGTGRAGDQDQTAVLLRQTSNARRQLQALEVGHDARDDTERERDVTPLPERVDTEARQPWQLVRGVELAGRLERPHARRREDADLLNDRLQFERAERLPAAEWLQLAVEPDD